MLYARPITKYKEKYKRFAIVVLGKAVNSGYCSREQSMILVAVIEVLGVFKKGRVGKNRKQRLKSRGSWRNCDTFFFFHSFHHAPRGGGGIKCEIRTGKQTAYLSRPEMPGESSDWTLTAVTISTGQRDFSHDARETWLSFARSETIYRNS